MIRRSDGGNTQRVDLCIRTHRHGRRAGGPPGSTDRERWILREEELGTGCVRMTQKYYGGQDRRFGQIIEFMHGFFSMMDLG